MHSDSGLPRLHMRQIAVTLAVCGRGVASCATMPLQIATHSSQMNPDGPPSMSWRTALCGLLQNEQRYSRLLKKCNIETSRFTYIAQSRQKEVLGSAFVACRTTSFGPLQTDTVSGSCHRPWRKDGYQPLGAVYTHNPLQVYEPSTPQPSLRLQLES